MLKVLSNFKINRELLFKQEYYYIFSFFLPAS